MPQYRYRALNADGKVISGIHTSQSEHDLEQLLSKLRLEMVSCQELSPIVSRLKNRRVTRRDLINFCFYLEQMTRSGISIVDALVDLQASFSPSYLSEIIGILVGDIREGKTFSESLHAYPGIFNTIFVSLIEAGERSGELSHVLKDLTDMLTWQDELIAQTKKALMMPMLTLLVVFGVVFALMTFLVPQLIPFIQMMGQELPLHTQLLIVVSDFFIAHWLLILVLPVILLVALKVAVARSQNVRFMLDKTRLKLWMVGAIFEKIILARFANYLALLYNSGIPVIESIRICEGLAGNLFVERAIRDARNLVSEGATVSSAFEMTEIFPRLVISMLNVGEKTGDLGASLKNVSYFYKRDVDEAIDTLQRLIEPMMTMLMGAIIGWVMVAVMGPIYDLISNIKM